MLNWYDWILMGVGIVIIVLCLLQGGKSEGASGAITGGGLNVFVKTKERGAEKVVSILTLIFAIVFFIIAIIIEVVSAAKGNASASEATEAAVRLFF
ncbi:MAG: preprotein translocase subunit SecG [Bacilli bacterium]|nr:preprotein translocase subunit SecG [Bacilli bacterium]